MRLLDLDNDGIVKYLNSLEKESKAIKREMIQIAWHMRGGVGLNEAYTLSYTDRVYINKMIADHMETTHKTGLPFF